MNTIRLQNYINASTNIQATLSHSGYPSGRRGQCPHRDLDSERISRLVKTALPFTGAGGSKEDQRLTDSEASEFGKLMGPAAAAKDNAVLLQLITD